MRLHDHLCRALPVIYVTCGALIFLGAAYVGIGHGLMPVYAALGLVCMVSGLLVAGRSTTGCAAASLSQDLSGPD